MFRRLLHGLLLLALLTNAIGSPWAMAAHGSHHADEFAPPAPADGGSSPTPARHHAHHVAPPTVVNDEHAHHSAMIGMADCREANDCADDASDHDMSCCGDAGCQCGCLHSATPLRAVARETTATHQSVYLASRAARPAARRTPPPFRPPAA